VPFCDRNCNVIAPFVAAPGNRNESPILRQALPQLTSIARAAGIELKGSIVSLDGVYDCQANRKAIFSRGMVPNPMRIRAAGRPPSPGASGYSCGDLQRAIPHY